MSAANAAPRTDAAFLADEAATLAYGAGLATLDLRTELVFLHGDLGTGKTTLVRGFLRALGYAGAVKSPTYTLLESYALGSLRILHFDFYRIEDPRELGYMGIDELMADRAVKLVEWPDHTGDRLPPADLVVRLRNQGKGRHVEFADYR